MMKDQWIAACANRLIAMRGYPLTDAEMCAKEMAKEQEWRYGNDSAHWIAPWGAADAAREAAND